MDKWCKVLDEQSQSSNNLSPQAVQKGNKKLGNLRTRSPTGQSPASKTRKAAQMGKLIDFFLLERKFRDGKQNV